ncbi:MAG: hypothetical protein PHF29_03510 [Candidatus Riflebacteria bacterium]|nr:hypothetical protein [Candidatus Riflebacteria bacterium]
MIRMFNDLSCLLMVFCLCFVSFPAFCDESFVASDKALYNLPESVELKITEKARAYGESVRMSATIESKIGTLKNIRVFFNSSNDLKVLSETRTIEALEQGEKQVINIIAVKMGDNPGDLGSWIRLGIRYTPDHNELLKIVSDETSYPVKHLRERLISEVHSSMDEGEPYLDAIRHFVK